MLRAPISGSRRVWLDLSVSNAPPKRINMTLFDNVYKNTSDRVFDVFKSRAALGPISGIIRNEFILIGQMGDPRNKFGITDKSNYLLQEEENEEFFNYRHRHKGLLSVEEDTAGSQFGITLSECPYFDGDWEGMKSVRLRKVIGIVENPEDLDIFHEVPTNEEYGLPMVQVEIVNTGICEELSPEYLAMVKQFNNDIVAEYFKDLRPRQRLHWKIITGNYDQIEVKDVGRFLWTYGVVIGILIASYNIIQKKDYRSDLIPNQFIPVYKKQIEREKQYLKELSERLK